jgi:hypothetical protein
MTTRLNEWAGAPGVPEPDDLVERALRIYRAFDVQQDVRAVYARLLEEAFIARQGGQRPRADELERAAAQLRERWPLLEPTDA